MKFAHNILFFMATISVGTVGAQVPAPPQSARVRIIDDNTLEVTVEPPVDGVTHYNVSLTYSEIISTNRPSRSSRPTSDSPPSRANDGDLGRTFPNIFHSQWYEVKYMEKYSENI